jgi:parvulin-like peptidyl-prolyl isomerase
MRSFPSSFFVLANRSATCLAFGLTLGHGVIVYAQDEALSSRSKTGKTQTLQASAPRSVQQPDIGPAVVATVNGQSISLEDFAKQCVARHGEELLENMVNRTLLLQACQARNIEITKKDVDDEIARTASKFGLSVPTFLKLLQDERNIAPEHYATDIVWHMLSLRALSKETIKISPQELDLAFQREFGPKVQVRMIACRDLQKLTQLHQQALTNPDTFKTLARDHSEDPASASVEGLLPPIRKNTGDDEIERISFSLQPGEISKVFSVGELHITLQCVRHFPPASPPAAQLVEIQNRIRSDLEEEKLRQSAEATYTQLRSSAQVITVLGKPELSQQYPGVAAVINGQALMMSVLEKECVKRFGPTLLDNEINLKLVEQALTAQNLQVTPADIDAEIRYTAEFYGYVKADGSPDLDRWIADVINEEEKTVDMYIRDVIQPTVALKKLVAPHVQITEEDIQKGFEANFGTRAEVLAIVLSNQRTAQEVWEMARNRPTEQFFGELANQYSVEPSSRSNFGKVPPLRRHGGQPNLEKAAFGLKPGEMSAIIEIGGQYVILRCQGFTEPVVQDLNAVRNELQNEIREKKTRIEMDNTMSKLLADAQVTNFLAPKKSRLGAAEKQATIDELRNMK